MAHGGHGHGHGCSDEHDHDDPERGRQFSLYTKINKDHVECLNESVEGSGKDIFKPWDERLDKEKVGNKLIINNNKLINST